MIPPYLFLVIVFLERECSSSFDIVCWVYIFNYNMFSYRN